MFSFKKIIFFIFFILIVSISAQHKGKRGKIPTLSPVSIETHIVPSDTIFTCFISYKVPYRNLMFIKENGTFYSAITLTTDISKLDNHVDRVIKKSSTVVHDYELTNSNKIFLQDVTSVKLSQGTYTFTSVVSIENTDIEVKLKPIEVIVDSIRLSKPFTVFKEKIPFNNKLAYILTNDANSIPYSMIEYDLLIPVFDKSIQSIELEVEQNGKSKIRQKLIEYEDMNFSIEAYKKQILINQNEKYPEVKLFKYPSINKNLIEGESKIKITMGERSREYNIPVSWISKPRSLRNPETAIEMLQIIDKNKEVDSLLSFPEEDYYDVLFDYWSKLDNDTSTAFNEVFELFYSRVDYANNNFKSLNGDIGALSDRGKTYVKFGEPDSIERTYNEQYNIIEIWEYKSLKKKIIFSDETGTGNFIRVK
ncbi:MAG: GWxTD domain-containing protein [Bacteroidota bacterium]